MFLNYKEFDKKNINIKNPLNYNNYNFFKLDYNGKDIIFETPKLFIPYGINNYNSKYNLSVSFQNMSNNNDTRIFLNKLQLIEKNIKIRMKRYNINYFIKNKDKNYLMKLKVDEKILIYDNYKNLLSLEKIEKLLYGKFIIYLSGLWESDGNIWFEWNLLQAKIYLPLYLSEYSFSDDLIDNKIYKGKGKSKGPPPPPPPVSVNNKSRIVINKVSNTNKLNNNNNNVVPSLEQILSAINNLREI